MILKINGNIDLPFSNTIALSKRPQVSKPVVNESKIIKNGLNKEKIKKVLKYSSVILLPIFLSGISHVFADFTFEVPDTVKEQMKHMKIEDTMNPVESIQKKYKKNFMYRHSGVLTRIIVDKSQGETFEQHWEAFGFKCFEIFKSILVGFLKGIGKFIVINNDLFFLFPAFIFLFGTFLVGKHKYTKWTLPLFFAYFISQVFKGFLL